MGMGLFGNFSRKDLFHLRRRDRLLGNRRLADGNLCKKCARAFAWFDERRERGGADRRTVRDRERNLENCAASRARAKSVTVGG
ncbi:hypothetical protein RAH42_12885 [Pyramidobacter sp. YE332]|uniref:hypothetical protein n=1 Tax=Pyramidobacter sp. YE332 TaxID=3068894 RepID=UPI00294AC651|nr:hypothetical protein [Pyramidobacter sp. YE332]WOL40013.1 hypothetical protein RAH42_12885 [Pyramidobacter sp. YE332]